MRNRLVLATVLGLALVVINSVVIGQDRDRDRKKGGFDRGRFPYAELKLSDEQKQKVEDIQKEFREKMSKIRDEEKDAINKVLTDDQKEKYEQIQKDRRDRFGKSRDRDRDRDREFDR